MNHLMQDPMVIYAIAFVIFMALVFVYARKPATQWLDAEIAKIRQELDTARQLRAEAEAALVDCKAKQVRAENEARVILENAKRDAENFRKRAEVDLATSLARHEHLAAERIRLAQDEAIADVRQAAIDAALQMARKALTENMADADASRLVDQAIADLPALKKASPKAA